MEEIDSETFARWRVFNAIDPEAGKRADWHTASLLAMLRNVNSSAGSVPSTPKDFMVDAWSEEARHRLLDEPEPEQVTTKRTVEFLAGIPGVTVTVLKPEALEDEHH